MAPIELNELAVRVERGDRGAEDPLCRALQEPLLRFARRLGMSDMLAEDLTQDTLMLIIQRLRECTIEKPETLTTFAFSTIRNLLIASARRDNHRRELLNIHGEMLVPSAEPDAPIEVEQKEESQRVTQILGRLTMERDREILVQHYLFDLDRPTVQRNLGLNPCQFDRVISRARQRAREKAHAQQLDSIADSQSSVSRTQ